MNKDFMENDGFYVTYLCNGCGVCASACPENCINTAVRPAKIDDSRCIRCGSCAEACPPRAIEAYD